MCALALFYPSIHLLEYIFSLPQQNVIALSIYSVVFPTLGALGFYPFIPAFVRFLQRFIPEKKGDYILRIADADSGHIQNALHAFHSDVVMLLKKIYKLNVHQFSIDQKILLDKAASMETKYGASYKLDNENLMQEYNVVLTIEEALVEFVLKLVKNAHLNTSDHTVLSALREAVERMVYSAKTLNDVKNDLDDLHALRNPLIDEYLHMFKVTMIDLYFLLSKVIDDHGDTANRALISKYQQDMISADERFLDTMSDKLLQDKLTSGQLSSLVHVSQALTRSHKAMLHTVDILFLHDLPDEIMVKNIAPKGTVTNMGKPAIQAEISGAL